MKKIDIGLVGAGTVGGGVVKLMHNHASFLQQSCGIPVVLRRIADKATNRFAELPVDNAICSDNADDILNDKDVDVVIELVGGTGFARELILNAIGHGKHVITANKALIAEYGPDIFEAAEKKGVSVYFEASVGGGMPVIKTIREALIGNNMLSAQTVINGTCNYILTKMSDQGLGFDAALKAAQKYGYAEADPTLDVGGGDSGHKVAIMASLLFDGYVPYKSIYIEGITQIDKEDIEFARELGYCIKLLGIIRRDVESGEIDARVHPAMLNKKHMLAWISGVYNAVLLEGDAVGSILLSGKGAGEMPTASAVMSDIADVAYNIVGGSPKRLPMSYYSHSTTLPVRNVDAITSRYYLRFTVADRHGVLASIARVLGEQKISIASVMQKEGYSNNSVPVIFLTHKALEKNLRAALAAIEAMDFIRSKTQVIRIVE